MRNAIKQYVPPGSLPLPKEASVLRFLVGNSPGSVFEGAYFISTEEYQNARKILSRRGWSIDKGRDMAARYNPGVAIPQGILIDGCLAILNYQNAENWKVRTIHLFEEGKETERIDALAKKLSLPATHNRLVGNGRYSSRNRFL